MFFSKTRLILSIIIGLMLSLLIASFVRNSVLMKTADDDWDIRLLKGEVANLLELLDGLNFDAFVDVDDVGGLLEERVVRTLEETKIHFWERFMAGVTDADADTRKHFDQVLDAMGGAEAAKLSNFQDEINKMGQHVSSHNRNIALAKVKVKLKRYQGDRDTINLSKKSYRTEKWVNNITWIIAICGLIITIPFVLLMLMFMSNGISELSNAIQGKS